MCKTLIDFIVLYKIIVVVLATVLYIPCILRAGCAIYILVLYYYVIIVTRGTEQLPR